MTELPAFLREILTYDRGKEMTCHVELAKSLNLDIWVADKRHQLAEQILKTVNEQLIDRGLLHSTPPAS